MTQCPGCGGEVAKGSRFCGACGAPVDSGGEAPTKTSAPSAVPTEMAPPLRKVQASPVSPSRSSVTSSSVDQGRFIPGTVLAKRYRIIGLLGRGGMGEVYRADDLKLGQPVALKFLPRGLEKDEGRLQRFLNEVRMALKVSHPNVCRVHDIGELEGQHYISMEYVDGEDLSSLLRRIGRLPKDKAVQAARQLCAGLAAAHDQGVLHRDLKPANVMIDGRGQVKITDFGLAGLDDSIEGAEARAGTPAYMSPEQWAGKEITTRSDLYALGLVLYELFTGDQPYKGKTPAEILELQEQSSPTTPSSLVEGFDPAVERLILKCLAKEPSQRPQSALAISAALPGGDPLAAALAAGETPSPELVAQAGGSEGVDPKLAVGLFVAAIALFGIWLAVAPQIQIMGFLKAEKSPDVLVERARQIIRDVGYDESPLDSLFDFMPNMDYFGHISETESSPDRWEILRQSQPAAMHFRYRQAPDYISKVGAGTIGLWMEDPPVDVAGEVMLELDLEGRLLSFLAVPPERAEPGVEVLVDVDWQPILRAAGLEPAELTPQLSTWLPPYFADNRAAWSGVYPDAPEVEIRVEAAAFQGRPVAMKIFEPWSTTRVEAAADQRQRLRIASLAQSFIPFGVLIVAMLVAWRNVRLGRGDRKTAIRFAAYLGAVRLVWMFGAHHVPAQEEGGIIFSHLAFSAWRVVAVMVFYLAVEPYARKFWPHLLITWMRFVGGRWRDPLVGRDILVGLVLGMTLQLTVWVRNAVFYPLTGLPGDAPGVGVSSLEALRGGGHLITALATGHTTALVMYSLMVVLILVILRLILRHTWLAIVGLVTLMTLANWPVWSSPIGHVVFLPLLAGMFLFCLFRFGFLTIVVANVFRALVATIPMTYDMSAWYIGGTLVVVVLFLGTAVYAFRTALAGRPLFHDELAADSPATS